MTAGSIVYSLIWHRKIFFPDQTARTEHTILHNTPLASRMYGWSRDIATFLYLHPNFTVKSFAYSLALTQFKTDTEYTK